MIGKLLKNDFKASLRAMGNIYLAVIIASAAMLLSAFLKSGFMRFLTSAAVIVVAAVAVIVTFVSVVFGANKSLFGREGYLSQTIPVRASSLIFSKWFTSSVWVLLSYAVVLIAFLSVAFYWTIEDAQGAQLYDMIYSFLQSLGLADSVVIQKAFIVQALLGLFNACILVMYILFAITLSNVSPLNKLGSFGIIIYLALTLFTIQGISWWLESLCDITLIIDSLGEMSMTVNAQAAEQAYAGGGITIGFTAVYFKAIVTVFIYILTVQLTETKINLK